MNPEFYKFNYIEFNGEDVISQDEAYCYTTSGNDPDKIKKFVRHFILKKPAASVAVYGITSIDRTEFIKRTGEEPLL